MSKDLERKQNRKKIYILLLIGGGVLIILFCLWLFDIFNYFYLGMAALPDDNKNHRLFLSDVKNSNKIELYISDLERNNDRLLYENGECKVVIEHTDVSIKEDVLYIRLNCYGSYDLTQTIYYTPKEDDYQIGQIHTTNGQSFPVEVRGVGPMKKDYYIVDAYILKYSELSDDKVMLEIPWFVKHDYERTGWI